MILGIDVSTSITGICVLSKNGQVLEQIAVDMKNKSKFSNIYLKADAIYSTLEDLMTKYVKENQNIEKIFIEEKLLSFKKGKSSPKILARLTEFNGMVSLMCYQIFGTTPEHIHPSSARKLAGIKIKRGTNAKKQVIDFLLDSCLEFVVEYTKKGNIKAQYYDIADAIVIAKAGMNKKE